MLKRVKMKMSNPLKGEDESLDAFYLGRISVLQKKKGYRFSVDAPLLADFIQTRHSDEILELGPGNGIVSLLLSIKPFKHITAVEIQESLTDLARRNIKLNNLEERISVVREDLCCYRPGKKFDVIFSNPPYIQKGKGHLSSSLEKSIAKHELTCNIFDVMKKTAQLLKSDGRAFFIFHAERKDDFLQAVNKNELKIKSLRYIHPRKESPPNLFLTECNFFSKKMTTLPPFILYNEQGKYMKEAEEIFRGRSYAP